MKNRMYFTFKKIFKINQKNIRINYELYIFRPGNGHQPNPKLFDKIVKSV